jgi:ATP-dependent Lon protease
MTLREVTRTVISLVEKGAAHVLMPISARKQLNDLPDDVLTKVTLFYYSDPRDALIKGLAE